MEDDPTFDVVIVGGGPSAMGLLLGLLDHLSHDQSSTPRFTIAVIERGEGGCKNGIAKDSSYSNNNLHDDGRERGNLIAKDTSFEESPPTPKSPLPSVSILDPSQWHDASHIPSSYSSVYISPPQPGLNKRQIAIPTGRGLGGGSNINACLVMSPDFQNDFQSWPGIWKGGQRLQKASNVILETMDKSKVELFHMCPEYERICSNRTVHRKRSETASFVEAVKNTGRFPFLSTSTPLAVVRSTTMKTSKRKTSTEKIQKYSRANYFDLLVHPLLQERPHLLSQNIVTFYSETQAERIIFSGRRAISVRCSHVQKQENKKEKCSSFINIRARREVILCCGAILTPALLLASGVGHPDELKKEGIQPLCGDMNEKKTKNTDNIATTETKSTFGLSSVGRNLRDHIVLPRAFFSLQSLRHAKNSINTIQGVWNAKVPFDWKHKKSDTNHSFSAATRRNEENIQIHIDDAVIVPQILPRQFGAIARALGNTFCSLKEGRGGRISRFTSCIFVSLSHIVEMLLFVVLNYTPIGWFLCHHTVIFTICLLNLKSKGTVTLRRRKQQLQYEEKSGCTSTNMLPGTTNDQIMENSPAIGGLRDFDIIVDPKYLSDSRDINLMKVAFNSSDELRKKWFSRSSGFLEICPGFLFRWLIPSIRRCRSAILSLWNSEQSNKGKKVSAEKDFLESYVADFVNPYYHFCGSCTMGSNEKRCTMNKSEREKTMGIERREEDYDECDDECVVNDLLQVYGLSSLRICDASVFPTCISSPTALICASLGYVTAALVLKNINNKKI